MKNTNIIICQIHPSGEYIFVVILLAQHLLYKACLPWQLPFLQHILVAVVQLSKYSIFHDVDTLIQLGLP